MQEVRKALLSVSNKNGIIEFASALIELGFEVISTGGTAGVLRQAGLSIRGVSEVTGFPEIFDGRVKTLHPKIHGGLLWRRDNPKDQKEATLHEIPSIDLVAVNLYPFEETISKDGVKFEDALEQIDIGGPAMLRASAKNLKHVIVIVDPDDYMPVVEALWEGNITFSKRLALAQKVFQHTSGYDSVISQYLERVVIE
ncbi:MAG TPA: IMP cyclohydrolase [Thermodesulfovibrionia bacterium]|nr:IMP cyclohydrolase [Thermodesulfovibrionia bacterium]